MFKYIFYNDNLTIDNMSNVDVSNRIIWH